MRKKIVFTTLFIIAFKLVGQNAHDYYKKDEAFHKSEVKKVISANKENFNKIAWASSINYAFNRTILIFIKNGDIKIHKIENEKFKKSIKSKVLDLKPKNKRRLIKLFKDPNTEINDSDCLEDDTIQHFKIEFSLNDKKIETSSRCIKALKQNKLFHFLLALLET